MHQERVRLGAPCVLDTQRVLYQDSRLQRSPGGLTARILDVPIAIVEKHRIGNEDRVEAANIIGHVEGKTALIIDDEIGKKPKRQCPRR